MAPILIDGRGLFKLGSMAVVITALIFFGGFFTGYQKASAFYRYTSEIQQLPIPEVAENDFGDRDQLTPDIAVMGENIDVDQPETIEQSKAEKDYHPVVQTEQAKTEAALATSAGNSADNRPDLSIDEKDNKVALATVNKAEISKAMALADPGAEPVNEYSRNKSDDLKNSSSDNRKTPEKSEISSINIENVDIEKARYSIQVGMYGSLVNAENMMKMLKAQNFNAYISDYKNKKAEIRYNVRFGYFQEKRLALSRLNEYKNQGKGDGYLVRFSAENLVDVAKTGDIKNIPSDMNVSPKTEVSGDKVHDEPKADLSQTELSQAEIVRPGSPAAY